ncbi:M14 family metallopeptidase [Pleionea sediminis]|uniref:M14 family metallopeptidase n=1 Tax=Pleionea sediminis TaxID=2569479 RepID=UPI0011872B59|nr:M14 family metallocarboxypeptidase [Pleionea sediminis]
MQANSTPEELLEISPWGGNEKSIWHKSQKVLRSYKNDVLLELKAIKDEFDVKQYGSLSFNKKRYPLFVVRTKDWDEAKPTVVVTGGVHGYETSGVHGALSFVKSEIKNYSDVFNIIVAPCISPWGYETINRWNPYTVDPNRSFSSDGEAEEATLFMKYIDQLPGFVVAHFDLHETTDSDNTTFRPAKAARDGVEQSVWNIPDGFYLVGNTERPEHDFQKAIIDNVREVTHIAPPDETGKIIGEPISQEGVINYPMKEAGLCAGFTDCDYATTTEVYPDSPRVTDEDCVKAQVAAVTGGLDFIKTQL